MNKLWPIFKMDMENLFKNPVLIGYNTIFSVLLTLIMGFLSSGAYQNAQDAYHYYTISFLVYAMVNGAMTATNSFMERDIKKPNLRIIHSPAGSFSIYFSKIIASALFDFICHLLMLFILMGMTGFAISGQGILCLVLLMIPIELSSAALGVFICCLLRAEESSSMILSLLVNIFAFLGGTFFSLDGMGKFMAILSCLSPIKWINHAFFTIVFDGNFSLVGPVLAVSFTIFGLLLAGSTTFFKAEDYLC